LNIFHILNKNSVNLLLL